MYQTLIPRVFSDPDLVQTLAKFYNADTHCINSTYETINICTVSSEVVARMLSLPLAVLPILELNLLKKVESYSF
jgi:hypothetical protein